MTEPTGSDPAETAVPSSEGTDPATPAAAAPTGAPGPAGIDVDGVTGWFESHVDGVRPPLHFELVAGGRSNLTFAVTDAGGRRYVLRRPPTGPLLPTAHDMGREHRVLSAVGPAGVPVPTTLGLCQDPAVTGAPFYVMDFVVGHILRSESEVLGLFDEGQRAAIGYDLVDTLVGIHALDPDRVGLGDLSRKEGYIARQLKRWYAQYQASRDTQAGPDVPEVDEVHRVLSEHIPEQGPAGIVHGDYRLDNTMVNADGRVAAVLDWELCTLGDTMADLGQLLVYWSDPGEPSALEHSATTAPGFPTRADLVARYAETSGRSVEGIDFYLAFAYWKLACILEGVYTRYAAGAMGRDGFDFSGYPATIRQLGTQAADTAARVG